VGHMKTAQFRLYESDTSLTSPKPQHPPAILNRDRTQVFSFMLPKHISSSLEGRCSHASSCIVYVYSRNRRRPRSGRRRGGRTNERIRRPRSGHGRVRVSRTIYRAAHRTRISADCALQPTAALAVHADRNRGRAIPNC
jgi:hypothetical protein